MQPDGNSFLQLMRACGQRGDASGAAEWLKAMQKSQLEPERTHFHAVMAAHAKVGDLPGAEAWLRVMMDAGLRPDLVTFNILLSAAASQGDTKGAEAALIRCLARSVETEDVCMAFKGCLKDFKGFSSILSQC